MDAPRLTDELANYGLHDRVINALQAAGFSHIDDVRRASDEQLMLLDDLSDIRIADTRRAIERVDLGLPNPDSDATQTITVPALKTDCLAFQRAAKDKSVRVWALHVLREAAGVNV